METMLIRLESVLNIGYSILLELENEDPDIEKIELLYDKRSRLLNQTKSEWNESGIHLGDEEESSAKENLEDFRNMFFRLSLLEKNLNRKLESLKLRKSEVLSQLDQLKKAKKSYGNYAHQKPMSLFMDIKPGLN